MSQNDESCPCGSGLNYADCCHPLHTGAAESLTAEQLMRSRYSAYSMQLIAYLVTTTHPDKRSPGLAQEIADWAEQVKFYRLEILSTFQGQALDKIGKVKFVAHYHQQGKDLRLSELSRFRRYKKRWFYVDGAID